MRDAVCRGKSGCWLGAFALAHGVDFREDFGGGDDGDFAVALSDDILAELMVNG